MAKSLSAANLQVEQRNPTSAQRGCLARRFAPAALSKLFPKSQTSKALGQKHVLHALVEAITKCQTLKVFWESHTLKATVEVSSKSFSAFKAVWRSKPFKL